MASGSSKINSVLAWIWFPIALVVLFLLALPGLILFGLYLAGREPQTNAWLQERFNFSYHPQWPVFSGLLLLLPLLILLLYFLKLKRKPLQVPSTFLWKKSIEDLHVNSLFQWLRQNILLLLQLLIVLALFYAVLGFRFYGDTNARKHYILMIDNSASMATKDKDGISRLDWAKREALKEIDAGSDDDFGMVIAFNSKATTLQAYTNNKAKLRDAVQSIAQTQRPTRIEEALNLADSLANPLQSTEDVAMRPEEEEPGKERTYVPPKGQATLVYLFSDGRFPDLTESELANLNSKRAGNTSALGNIRMNFRSAGAAGADNVNNVGIVGFNAVRLTDKDGKIGDPDILQLQVLVRVNNYRAGTAANLKMHLDVLVNGRLVHPEQTTINVPPRKVKALGDDGKEKAVDEPGEMQVTFKLPALNVNDNPVLRVSLPNVKDDFVYDNEAWLAFGRPRKAKVLIVTPSNMVLRAFFNQTATRKVASVQWMSPSELENDAYRKLARSGNIDLVIFDRCAPKSAADMPQANTFFIDQPPPPWEKAKKSLKYPILMVSRRNHPLVQQLTTLWDLRVVSAWPFDSIKSLPENIRDKYTLKPEERDKQLLPQETRLIEAGGNAAIVFTLPRGSYTDLVMGFPLLDKQGDLVTDWPLQPSFPLFLRNVLYVLGGVNDSIRADTTQPGVPMLLRPEAGVNSLAITTPQGNRHQIKRGNHPYFVVADTEKLGVYDVVSDDKARRRFTVNLLDTVESNIEPRPAIEIGDEKIEAGGTRRQPQDIWKWIVLAAVGFLLLEWYIYNRRVYV